MGLGVVAGVPGAHRPSLALCSSTSSSFSADRFTDEIFRRLICAFRTVVGRYGNPVCRSTTRLTPTTTVRNHSATSTAKRPVPEPTSMALGGVALAGLGLRFASANIDGWETTWQVLGTPPKPVKVRAADGGEQQRIRPRRDDAVKA